MCSEAKDYECYGVVVMLVYGEIMGNKNWKQGFEIMWKQLLYSKVSGKF
jgi:hypothetical protein